LRWWTSTVFLEKFLLEKKNANKINGGIEPSGKIPVRSGMSTFWERSYLWVSLWENMEMELWLIFGIVVDFLELWLILGI